MNSASMKLLYIFKQFVTNGPVTAYAKSDFVSQENYDIYLLIRKISQYRTLMRRIKKYVLVSEDSLTKDDYYNTLIEIEIKILDAEYQLDRLLKNKYGNRNGDLGQIFKELYTTAIVFPCDAEQTHV